MDGSPERDIAARFIELANRAPGPSKLRNCWYLNRFGQIVYPAFADDRIVPDIASAYAEARAASLVKPTLAWQSAKTEEETSEKLLFQAIDWQGVHDPETMAKAYRLQVAMFLSFCQNCVRARSYEIALELERHQNTGEGPEVA